MLKLNTAAEFESDSWVAVKLPDGRAAFMRDRDVRSPVDYRACFEADNGRWYMKIFVAGG